MSNSDQPVGDSPYDIWLIDNHPITLQFPLDDTKTNKLIVSWYLPGSDQPNLRLSRLINVMLDKKISTQDTLDLNDDRGYIEISAEFDTDGTLIRSPEYHDDPLFREITQTMTQIHQMDGSKMRASYNGEPYHYFFMHEGRWLSKQDYENSLPSLRDNPNRLD